jgi:hypothetical protein
MLMTALSLITQEYIILYRCVNLMMWSLMMHYTVGLYFEINENLLQP